MRQRRDPGSQILGCQLCSAELYVCVVEIAELTAPLCFDKKKSSSKKILELRHFQRSAPCFLMRRPRFPSVEYGGLRSMLS